MISLLVESGVRSLLFAGAVGLVLRLGRVRDVTTRLTAWTCVLYGALLLPMAAAFLPPLPVPVLHPGAIRIVAVMPTVGLSPHSTEVSRATAQTHQVDWR